MCGYWNCGLDADLGPVDISTRFLELEAGLM